MNTTSKIFGAVLFCAVAVAPRVQATEILTTTLSAWQGTITTGSASEWNFNFPGNGAYSTASGYNLNPGNSSYGTTVVTGPDGSGYNLNKNGQYPGGSALQGAADGVGQMLFTTPASGYTAFLFGIGEYGNAAPITLSLSDGETFTVSPTVGSSAFVGLSSATQITSFVLSTASGSQVELTDFFVGNTNQPASTATAPAAEVTTALMIGTGLFFFGARRKVFSAFSSSRA